jgi:hypothetical protein
MKVDPLERLKDAGRATTPGFSEALHARVMGDVRRATKGQVRSRVAWVWWGGAVAAMVVAAVWVSRPTVEREERVAVDPAALAEVRELDSWVRDAVRPVAEGKYGYLDRDGKRLVGFLLSHVPPVPAGPREGRS